MPYVTVLSDFREKVRSIARDQKSELSIKRLMYMCMYCVCIICVYLSVYCVCIVCVLHMCFVFTCHDYTKGLYILALLLHVYWPLHSQCILCSRSVMCFVTRN